MNTALHRGYLLSFVFFFAKWGYVFKLELKVFSHILPVENFFIIFASYKFTCHNAARYIAHPQLFA